VAAGVLIGTIPLFDDTVSMVWSEALLQAREGVVETGLGNVFVFAQGDMGCEH
jgi:hypothetical protein